MAPRRRRRTHGLERVLGTPALFATAYGNVGSSIYYALGVTAAFALGLTPLVFVIAGIIFAATAADVRRGHRPLPRGRRLFELCPPRLQRARQLRGGLVADARTTSSRSPSRRSSSRTTSPIFWEPLRENPWDIVGGAVVIVMLVALNIVGVQEAARLNILLAVIDFATQRLLVALGFVARLQPGRSSRRTSAGASRRRGATSSSPSRSAMIAYTGDRDRLQPGRGGARPAAQRPQRVPADRGRRLRHLLHAAR